MVESGVDCPEINARKDGVRNGPLFLITTLEVAISKHLLQLTPTKMKDSNLLHPTPKHLEKKGFLQRTGRDKVLKQNHGSVVDTYFSNLCEAKKAPVSHEDITDCDRGKVSIAGGGFRGIGYGDGS